MTQPWFIKKLILDLLHADYDSSKATSSIHFSRPSRSSAPNFSFHAIIIFILSTIQTVSGACLALIHTYKNTINTLKRMHKMHHSPNSHSQQLNTFHIPVGYAQISVAMFSEVFALGDRLVSSVTVTVIRLLTQISSSYLNRLLPHVLSTCISASLVLDVARISKHNLFPNGHPGVPPVEPPMEEQAAIHAHLVAWSPSGAIGHLLPPLLGTCTSHLFETALEPLSDASCNTHLLLFLVDCVIQSLFPELVKQEIVSGK